LPEVRKYSTTLTVKGPTTAAHTRNPSAEYCQGDILTKGKNSQLHGRQLASDLQNGMPLGLELLIYICFANLITEINFAIGQRNMLL
jgi:hypothetical protein